MVLAVRGVEMHILGERVVWSGPGLWPGLPTLDDIAKAFGFDTEEDYLDTLEREKSRIFRRMRW